MNENMKKETILKAMTEVDCYPVILEDKEIQAYNKVPVGQLAAFGSVMSSVAPMLKNITQESRGTETLYRMWIPNGLGANEALSVAKTGGLLGNVIDESTGKITQRARFFADPKAGTTVAIDPATMLMAIAISSITQKLDSIEEAQKDIIEFLQLKEKAKLKGNVAVLQEILDEYKYNCENEKYKNNKHIQVQEIKRDAEQSIIFCREQIEKKGSKTGFLHSDHDVKVKMQKLQYEFKDYELALYLFSFSSFLEVMLLENFDGGYLNAVSDKIGLYASQYHELYQKCYKQLEGESKTSIQSHVIRGVAGLNKALGKTIGKIPKIKDGNVDENLIAAGERVEDFNAKRSENTMEFFVCERASCVDPFLDNIQAVNRIYNEPMEVLFDEENVYFVLGAVGAETN